ncbi:hypothetical protein D3C80_2033580 [compost metagenome]
MISKVRRGRRQGHARHNNSQERAQETKHPCIVKETETYDETLLRGVKSMPV